MIKNKKAIAGMLVVGGMVAGAVGSVGVAVHAQSVPVVQATTTQVEPVTANDPLKALYLDSTDVITLLIYNFNLHYSPSFLPLA